MKEDIHLDGIVLHSPDVDRLRDFYEALLDIRFKEEKHEGGPNIILGVKKVESS